MSLQAQSEERKKRLEQLKKMSLKRPADSIKFKSYVPETEELQSLVVEAPKLGPKAEDTVEKKAEEIKREIEEQDQSKEELDLSNLKPKKANWDLKRDLEKKMQRLDRLTEAAMADIIRI
jgi:coiled-coil domain-containing protein 12